MGYYSWHFWMALCYLLCYNSITEQLLTDFIVTRALLEGKSSLLLYETHFVSYKQFSNLSTLHPFGIWPISESSNSVTPSKSTNHDLKIACAVCSRILFWVWRFYWFYLWCRHKPYFCICGSIWNKFCRLSYQKLRIFWGIYSRAYQRLALAGSCIRNYISEISFWSRIRRIMGLTIGYEEVK